MFHPDDADHGAVAGGPGLLASGSCTARCRCSTCRSRGPSRRRAAPSATVSFEFDAAQAMPWREFCEREQVAPFVMLLAAYQFCSTATAVRKMCRGLLSP